MECRPARDGSLAAPEARTAKENLKPSLPESLVPSKNLIKQVRIVLTPVSAAVTERESSNKRWHQKSLFEYFANCEENSGEGSKVPKASSRQTQKKLAISPVSPASVVGGFLVESPLRSRPGSDMELDGSDVDASCVEDESTQLSAYERKRLKNVTENAKFFASLKLFESATRLRKTTTKTHPHKVKRAKHAKAETETTLRRSMRLQRVDPPEASLIEKQILSESSIEKHPVLPPDPIQMISAAPDQRMEEFLSEWTKISQVKNNQTEMPLCNLESYKGSLRNMVLREDAVAKVVETRIFSVAVHPSESSTLVAAGDKWGHVGLWNLDHPLEDGVHAFLPHTQPVSCLHFSPANPAHLLSLSYDGTLRCGDVTRAVFDEVYRNGEFGLSSFDFLASDASTLVVGIWDGDVEVVDTRTPGTSCELSADLNSMVRTVHVHPIDRQYFIAAGARNVGVYDVRHLKKSGSQPVVSLTGHSKTVASAYFSPVTGNRVVTTCADDTLRIFGTNCLSSMAPLLTTIRHDNNTGRWLTRFRAVWDPKRDDCFVVGSMSRPREIQAFHASGELVHSFSNEDYLGSVCSINVWHPTRYIVVGGNSSGRLHVFKE
ncbi:WD repeat-containing protein 76 [Eublepharis macularius]|uniref:WD repeat-containing protein 76 n=1 Tax=Eublepharis macularius TaxID=481883 RepID=A0AA97KKH0_EUBMA|nr:WD repeat-containing protein 76 [Eublepharis macularius]